MRESADTTTKGTGKRRPRVAASSYLNTAPLIWSFARGARRGDVELLTDAAPARCADALACGEADVALVPAIEYQRLSEVAIVPGVCVGAREEVKSVVLVTRGARLEDVRSVALDRSSRTSAALVEILFREFLRREPRFEQAAPDLSRMLREHDAALLIGDPAMTFPREGLRVYDLAGLWREFTGHGFVFATWMTREDATPDALSLDFSGARDEGLAHAEEIATDYERSLGLPRTELLRYLRENVCFTPDKDMIRGLELFFRLAYRHGLTAGVRPLKMIERRAA